MKSIKKTLLILSVVFLSLGFLPNLALSEATICFEEPIAKALQAEILTCRETDRKIQTLIDNYEVEFDARSLMVDNLTERLTLLDEQIADEHERAEKYRDEWKSCGETLVDCQQKQVSRSKWFGLGAGSGLLIALLLIAL